MGEEYKRPWPWIVAIGCVVALQLVTLGLVVWLLIR
jgi:hypothetical protein